MTNQELIDKLKELPPYNEVKIATSWDAQPIHKVEQRPQFNVNPKIIMKPVIILS